MPHAGRPPRGGLALPPRRLPLRERRGQRHLPLPGAHGLPGHALDGLGARPGAGLRAARRHALRRHPRRPRGDERLGAPRKPGAGAGTSSARSPSAPRFTAIEVERGIVREEILEDLDDDGRDVDADNIARALIYDKHPLGYTITGGLAALERFDEPLLCAHHARHYTGDERGALRGRPLGDPDAVARTVEQCFSRPAARREGARHPRPRAGQKRARFSFVENTSSQTDLRVAFRAVERARPAASPRWSC